MLAVQTVHFSFSLEMPEFLHEIIPNHLTPLPHLCATLYLLRLFFVLLVYMGRLSPVSPASQVKGHVSLPL